VNNFNPNSDSFKEQMFHNRKHLRLNWQNDGLYKGRAIAVIRTVFFSQ